MLTDYLAYQKNVQQKPISGIKNQTMPIKKLFFKAGNYYHRINFQREVVDSLLLNVISKQDWLHFQGVHFR